MIWEVIGARQYTRHCLQSYTHASFCEVSRCVCASACVCVCVCVWWRDWVCSPCEPWWESPRGLRINQPLRRLRGRYWPKGGSFHLLYPSALVSSVKNSSATTGCEEWLWILLTLCLFTLFVPLPCGATEADSFTPGFLHWPSGAASHLDAKWVYISG